MAGTVLLERWPDPRPILSLPTRQLAPVVSHPSSAMATLTDTPPTYRTSARLCETWARYSSTTDLPFGSCGRECLRPETRTVPCKVERPVVDTASASSKREGDAILLDFTRGGTTSRTMRVLVAGRRRRRRRQKPRGGPRQLPQ